MNTIEDRVSTNKIQEQISDEVAEAFFKGHKLENEIDKKQKEMLKNLRDDIVRAVKKHTPKINSVKELFIFKYLHDPAKNFAQAKFEEYKPKQAYGFFKDIPKRTLLGDEGFMAGIVFKENDGLVYSRGPNAGKRAPEGTLPGDEGFITAKGFKQKFDLVYSSGPNAGKRAPEGTLPGDEGFMRAKSFNDKFRLVYNSGPMAGKLAPKNASADNPDFTFAYLFKQKKKEVKKDDILKGTKKIKTEFPLPSGALFTNHIPNSDVTNLDCVSNNKNIF